jgi:hypothetical protein
MHLGQNLKRCGSAVLRRGGWKKGLFFLIAVAVLPSSLRAQASTAATPSASTSAPAPTNTGGGSGPALESQFIAFEAINTLAKGVAKEIDPSISQCAVPGKAGAKILLQDSSALAYVAAYEAFKAQVNAFKEEYDSITSAAGAAGPGPTTPAPTPNAAAGTPPSVSYTIPSPTDWITAVGGLLANMKSTVTYNSSTFQPTNDAFVADLASALHGKAEIYSSTVPGNLGKALGEIQDDLQSLYASRVKAGGTLPTQPAGVTLAAYQKFNGLDSQVTTFLSSLNTSDGNGGTLLSSILKGKALKDSLGQEDAQAWSFCSLYLVADVAGGSTRQLNNWILEIFWHDPAPSFNGGAAFTYQLRDRNNQFLKGGTLRYMYGYTKWSPPKAESYTNFQP